MRFFTATVGLLMISSKLGLAQTAEITTPQPVTIPAEIEKVLKEAKWKRQEAMKARFNPILQDLSRRTEGSYQSLYLDAVYGVFFAKEPKPEKAFQEWQKKNKGLVEDPRLPVATRLASLNLQANIYLILGDEEKAVGYFVELIRGIADGPGDLAGFHLMQESLPDTLLVKFYGVESDYFKVENCYMGAISNVEALFIAQVLSWHEKKQPNRVSSIWDFTIAACGKIASLNDQKLNQFNLMDCPRLLVGKSDSMAKIGQKSEASNILRTVLNNFPEYPGFDEVTRRFLQLNSVSQ